jgi:hypothetical protein
MNVKTQVELVKNFIRAALDASGIDITILLWEDNWDFP